MLHIPDRFPSFQGVEGDARPKKSERRIPSLHSRSLAVGPLAWPATQRLSRDPPADPDKSLWLLLSGIVETTWTVVTYLDGAIPQPIVSETMYGSDRGQEANQNRISIAGEKD